MTNHQRFADHIGFVRSEGLDGVVALATRESKAFGAEPRGGPWATVIARDTGFAAAFLRQDVERYLDTCAGMRDALFDRDTAPGAPPEALMRCDIPALVVPGHDTAHATSAARYLEECLPRSQYWDVAVESQTEAATNARVFDFLHKLSA
jgi:hypothetical protein